MRTNAGADKMSAMLGNAAAAGAGTGACRAADYVALSENTTAPAASDTALTGELTANGLQRKQGTYAHTIGTNFYTITAVFTSTDPTPRTIAKVALFDAVSAGIMFVVSLLSPTAVIASGDTVTITETITL